MVEKTEGEHQAAFAVHHGEAAVADGSDERKEAALLLVLAAQGKHVEAAVVGAVACWDCYWSGRRFPQRRQVGANGAVLRPVLPPRPVK